jgi:hypothetical protein
VGLLPMVAVVVVALAAGMVIRRPAPFPVTPAESPVGRVARTAARWRAAGLVAGLVAAGVVLAGSHLGGGVLLAAPVCALGVLVGVVVGELRGPLPGGSVRSAAVEVRTVGDQLPAALTRAVACATAALALVLVTTTAMGSPDDMGRAGRSLVLRRAGLPIEGHGPWPGSWYAAPLSAVVAAGLLLGAVALVRVVRRPRPPDDHDLDDALRRRSAHAVVSAVGVLVGVPLAGTAAVAAGGLFAISGRPAWWSALGWVLVVVAPLALVLAARCAALLVVPARSRRPGPAVVGS